MIITIVLHTQLILGLEPQAPQREDGGRAGRAGVRLALHMYVCIYVYICMYAHIYIYIYICK